MILNRLVKNPLIIKKKHKEQLILPLQLSVCLVVLLNRENCETVQVPADKLYDTGSTYVRDELG